jgi:hypothetical protein
VEGAARCMVSRTNSRNSQRAITRGKIRKLQKAGLLSSKVNANAPPSNYVKSQLYKYRGVIVGKQSALKVSSAAKAAEYRNRIGEGGQGRVVVVRREKGERFRVTKTDEIKSTREAFGQTIEKTIGDKFTPPKPGEKLYYTIPRRKRGLGGIKRRTFSSFDEMLFYFSKYDIDFDEVEQYIEVERFTSGSRRERQFKREYNTAVRKLKRNRKKRPGRRK